MWVLVCCVWYTYSLTVRYAPSTVLCTSKFSPGWLIEPFHVYESWRFVISRRWSPRYYTEASTRSVMVYFAFLAIIVAVLSGACGDGEWRLVFYFDPSCYNTQWMSCLSVKSCWTDVTWPDPSPVTWPPSRQHYRVVGYAWDAKTVAMTMQHFTAYGPLSAFHVLQSVYCSVVAM